MKGTGELIEHWCSFSRKTLRVSRSINNAPGLGPSILPKEDGDVFQLIEICKNIIKIHKKTLFYSP